MAVDSILHHLPGPFNFLDGATDDPRRVGSGLLAPPQRVFLEDETAAPVTGFPVLESPALGELARALERYLRHQEAADLGAWLRRPLARTAVEPAWLAYAALLRRAVENVAISSYGRYFPHLFWLHHSQVLARLLKDTPRRVVRLDAEGGRRWGDALKYRLFERWVDRTLATVYDTVQSLAAETEDVEEELFPRLLRAMVDNVLILTEDRIGADLAELGSYFTGYLKIDGRDFRRRLAELDTWRRQKLADDPEVRAAVVHLFGADPDAPERLAMRPGFTAYLAARPGYDAARLLTPAQVGMWEKLLLRLKEFELFDAGRRQLMPVEAQADGSLVARHLPGAGRRGEPVRLSPATRPLDFMSPWVVDPLVARCGMIYDLVDFSEVVSVLRRSGSNAQDDSFRTMFRFQRRVNRVAREHRLQLEKYLGDGAFFSARQAAPAVAIALHVQRLYREALANGLPFDRGLRIALNFGEYRLIPMQTRPGEERYEFFGHGLVELSRLTTGKASREIDDIKTSLITLGYREEVVHRFFAPLSRFRDDQGDDEHAEREFAAHIDHNGHLINEGIVATAAFIDQLGREDPDRRLARVDEGSRRYVAFSVVDARGQEIVAGMRKLGVAALKGLDRLVVYEVVDLGGAERLTEAEPVAADGGLASVLEQAFVDARHPLAGRRAP